jgi:hypothetical protein
MGTCSICYAGVVLVNGRGLRTHQIVQNARPMQAASFNEQKRPRGTIMLRQRTTLDSMSGLVTKFRHVSDYSQGTQVRCYTSLTGEEEGFSLAP